MSVIDDVKARISLIDLIGRDVPLKREGSVYAACCPFHQERTASFRVFEAHFHCFGCGVHGDIFTWIERRQGVPFQEALRELARQAGVTLRNDAEAVQERAQREKRTDLLRRAIDLYHSLLTPEARAYLHGRGFTDEFIDQYKIGFAPGNVIMRLDVPVPDLRSVGLINEHGRDTVWNRLTFPIYGRYDDEVLGFNARAWPDTDRQPKYLAVPSGESPLINERGLRSPAGRLADGTRIVHIMEGDTDTATAVQAGMPAVGVRGAKGLKPEFAEKFANIDIIYVWGDADPVRQNSDGTVTPGAGESLIRRAGELFGNKARIVMLPEGEDANSWIGQKGHDPASVTRSALPYLDWRISLLPSNLTPAEIDRAMRDLIPVLQKAGSETVRAVYVKRLARIFNVPTAAIQGTLREASRVSANGNGHSRTPLADTTIIWEDRPLINPAMALLDDDVMITTVFLDKIVPGETDDDLPRNETAPYIVTSRREVYELTPANALARGIRYSESKVPSYGIVKHRWNPDKSYPYSVKNWVDGGASVSPWDVYSEVVGYFRRHVWYPDPGYYDFLALWTIGTYWYYLFPTYPYVHLNGTKRSGKTLTLEIISELAFNAVMAASMSSAAAYRTVESCSATLLLDEAENLQKRENAESDGDKLEILKAGYKRGGQAIRCTGENHEPTTFDVYSPKVFGSVFAIDKILSDRVVQLTLGRKPKDAEVEEFSITQKTEALQRTRDRLYCLMLEFGATVASQLSDGIHWDGVRDRDRELWTPILVLAAFFDNAHLEEASDLSPSDFLTVRMRELAADTAQERQARERLEQTEVLVIENTLDWVMNGATPVIDNWYVGSALLNHLQNVDGLGWLKSTRQVYGELEKMTAISKARDLGTQRAHGQSKQFRCVRLNRQRLEGVAERLGLTLGSLGVNPPPSSPPPSATAAHDMPLIPDEDESPTYRQQELA